MAQITSSNDIQVLKIRQFLGLNENPDGDTKIKNGEMSKMRNFRVTREKHLQIRPGTKTVLNLKTAWDAWCAESDHTAPTANPVFSGAWEGVVDSKQRTLAAFGGLIFSLDPGAATTKVVGQCTQDQTSFFGFSNKVYLLNGHEYMSWDGKEDSSFAAVEGYIPTVMNATTPAGGGFLLENVNRLTGKRKVLYSPDGKETVFHIPEKTVDEIISVKIGDTAQTYTSDLTARTFTITPAPAAGTNTLELIYRSGNGERAQVTGMRFSELYNGQTDSRVFLYGDGTNKTIYSGIDSATGKPSAEYFPDLYEAEVGEANTPITGMVRHYARLVVFKQDATYSMSYSTLVTATDVTTAAFYVTPVNRQFGNKAPGQVDILENNPLTLDDQAVYRWRSVSTSGNITFDERNAERISDRVEVTLQGFDMKETRTFNRKSAQEYWWMYEDKALILNYGADAWYLYTGLSFRAMVEVGLETYGFRPAGGVVHLSRQYRNDDGKDIDAYAATGSMDFDRDWVLKYSPLIFVAIQPESNARVHVTVETNRRSDYPEKIVSSGLAAFAHADFAHWSFGTNRKPQVRRVKMKVKKATFYKLVFKSKSASSTATVLETDVQLRYTGNVK